MPLGDYYYNDHISFIGIASFFIAHIITCTDSGIYLKYFKQHI